MNKIALNQQKKWTGNSTGVPGFRELVGMELLEWSEGLARIALDIGPEHMNTVKVAHGGVLATLFDSASGIAGTYCETPGHRRYCATITLTTNFMAPIKGGRVTVECRVRRSGKSVFFTEGEAFDEDGTLLGTSSGTFKYFPGSHKLEGVPVDG